MYWVVNVNFWNIAWCRITRWTWTLALNQCLRAEPTNAMQTEYCHILPKYYSFWSNNWIFCNCFFYAYGLMLEQSNSFHNKSCLFVCFENFIINIAAQLRLYAYTNLFWFQATFDHLSRSRCEKMAVASSGARPAELFDLPKDFQCMVCALLVWRHTHISYFK